MQLEEAILHCEEVAEEEEKICENFELAGVWSNFKCADEHRQLAEWLKELQKFREQLQWTLSSDRLPEIHKAVLVYAPTYNNIFCACCDDDGSWNIFGADTKLEQTVIAWMPLPDIPKLEDYD